MESLFFVGLLSIAFNDNSFQAIGFVFAACLILYYDIKLSLLFSILAAASLSMFFIDDSLMSSKLVVLIGMTWALSTSRRLKPLLLAATHSPVVGIVLLIFALNNVVQYVSGSGTLGLFETQRLSGLLWDANYYSLFLITLFLYYKKYPLFIVMLLAVAQSASSLISFLLYRTAPWILIYCIITAIVVYLVYPFFFDLAFSYFDNQYIKDRLFSLNLRVEWAYQLFGGDSLDGIAPHNSFISGLKKSALLTIIYFAIIFKYSKNHVNRNLLLLLSMTNDVILGPICFLIPFLINISDEPPKKPA